MSFPLASAKIFISQGDVLVDSEGEVCLANFDALKVTKLIDGYYAMMPDKASWWQAPEILESGDPSFAGDVYAFAMLCIEVSAFWTDHTCLHR